jgi:hypothetical protein
LENHLEKLLEGSFTPKSLSLTFRKDIESLGDALKVVAFGPTNGAYSVKSIHAKFSVGSLWTN